MRILPLALALVALPAAAGNWYYRPLPPGESPHSYCADKCCTGETWSCAWRLDGLVASLDGAVDWSAMASGDTLYVCGTHTLGAFGRWYLQPGGPTGTPPEITISGGCLDDVGQPDPGDLRGGLAFDRAIEIIDTAGGITIRDLGLPGMRIASPSPLGGPVRLEDLEIGPAPGIGVHFYRVPELAFSVARSTFTDLGEGLLVSATSAQPATGEIIGNLFMRAGRVPGSADGEAIGVQSGSYEISWNRIEQGGVIGIALFGEIVDSSIHHNLIRDVRTAEGGGAGWSTSKGIRLIGVCSACYNVTMIGNRVQDIDGEGIGGRCGGPGCKMHQNQVEGATVCFDPTDGFDLYGNACG